MLLIALAAAPAAAQETRAGTIEAKQAEKATHLAPRQPGRPELLLNRFEESLVSEPSGLYPVLGSVYAGGGFAGGLGYRRYLADNTHADVKFMESIKGYTLVQVSTDSWNVGGGRIDLHARAGWRNARDVGYHGLGIESPQPAVSFGLAQTYVGGDLSLRPIRRTELSVGTTYEDFSLSQGSDGRTVGALFDPQTAPGLDLDPSYWHTRAAIGYDWRPSQGYARRGGLYELRYHHYAGGPDDFNRLEGEVVQHVPLLRENYVLSFRGQAESILDDAATVPFYLLSSLGGSTTLRGYESWRFRDRDAVLATAELRWTPNRNALDMALFYDTGMVAPSFEAITLPRFKSNIGIGVRFHGPISTPFRFEVAHGREGFHLVFAGSAAF